MVDGFMRLATITNWAYGATVALTLLSGTTMVLASGAQDVERAAVAQRHSFDQATSRLEEEMFSLTDLARQYLNTADPSYRLLHEGEVKALKPVERRLAHLRDAGATSQEFQALVQSVRWADALVDEQQAALQAHDRGDGEVARSILFGAEYERELDRIHATVQRFQYQLDQRTDAQVISAERGARLWKRASELALGATGLLFLCVLTFVFRQRVLKPVVRLSDVVSRLAAEDFAAEPPNLAQIDEIGDMALAIGVFRENGLERQRLQAERDADRNLRDLLSRMTQRMQGCDSLSDLEGIARRFIPAVVPQLAGCLYLIDPARGAVTEACSWLDPRHSRADFPASCCWALRRGLPHRPRSVVIDVPCGHLVADHDGCPDTLCLPLTAHGETFGLLYFERRTDAPEISDSVHKYLTVLTENIGLSLANLRLREQLRALALRDPLTGLWNRRELDANLPSLLARCASADEPVSCLMIDVDHFKRFNDSFGHDAGDAVLREVATVLMSVAKGRELAYRFGGEEFLIVLPGGGLDHAMARAEQIRERIASLRIEQDGRRLGSVSASIGIASSPLHCSVSRLVQMADAALLRAKADGRDRALSAGAEGSRSAA